MAVDLIDKVTKRKLKLIKKLKKGNSDGTGI